MNLKEIYLNLLLLSQTVICDTLKINYLNELDKNICNYVSNQLPYVYLPIFNQGRRIPLNDFIDMSLEQIKILGDEAYLEVSTLLPKIPIYSNQRNHFFQTMIAYKTPNHPTMPDSEYTKSNTGTVIRYNIPKKLYNSDVILLSHEHCHSLKDTNYNEYINIYTLGEVIPMFLELIANIPNDNIKKRILQIRMHYLHNNKMEFLSTSRTVKKNQIENPNCNRNVDNYVQSRHGCYLNSFYYTLILYHMYKETPRKILTLISRVLKHEITTLEMLKDLGIYGDILGQTFEQELTGIKKVLKL